MASQKTVTFLAQINDSGFGGRDLPLMMRYMTAKPQDAPKKPPRGPQEAPKTSQKHLRGRYGSILVWV